MNGTYENLRPPTTVETGSNFPTLDGAGPDEDCDCALDVGLGSACCGGPGKGGC